MTGGLEDWKVQQLPRVMLSRSDLPGGAVKMCFASAELRDAFHAALSNLAAGKPWDAALEPSAEEAEPPPQAAGSKATPSLPRVFGSNPPSTKRPLVVWL